MTDFEIWESEVRENLGFSHSRMNDLAFKTLELCLEDIDIIDDFEPSGNPYQCDYNRKYKITENDFSKIDYIAYMLLMHYLDYLQSIHIDLFFYLYDISNRYFSCSYYIIFSYFFSF